MISKKTGELLPFVLIAACGIGAFAFYQYEVHTKLNREVRLQNSASALNDAEEHLKRGHPGHALDLLNQYAPTEESTLEPRWKKLVLKSAAALHDDPLLLSLWNQDPALFKDQENLTLRIAAYAISQNDLKTYRDIDASWKQKGRSKEWIILYADALLLQDRAQEAFGLLEHSTFEGDLESERLIRLALLNEKEHPEIAWNYLLKALAKNPERADLRLYRAQLLESSDHPELAKAEYTAAYTTNSQDPFYKEELIDYYLRHQKMKQASDFLQATLKSQTSDKLWLRALFLNKVYQPSKLNLAAASLPSGLNTPFVRYLLAIPETEFWDESLLTTQPAVERIAEKIPEAGWLRVFEDLKIGNEANALDVLVNNPDMAELNPALYKGLQQLILFQHPYLKQQPPSPAALNASEHPVFRALSEQEIPKEYQALLSSKEAYAILALASGWYEAALNLQHWYPNKPQYFTKLPPELPRWVVYGFAQALAQNRPSDDALHFIHKQTMTPQLAVLAGELYLHRGDLDIAEKILQPYAMTHSLIGEKSALLLSQIYIKKGQPNQARLVISNQPALANSTTGKESLARLELLQGNPGQAEKIYSALADVSSEAKSFLAKKAYQAGDYKTAYRLTKLLAEQFPEKTELKTQLRQISEAATKR